MKNFEKKVEQEPIDAIIESSLEHGVKFDEGQNAIILEVNIQDLHQDTLDNLFTREDFKKRDELVSKVLRVFNTGHSAEEAHSQIKAKKILDNQSEKGKKNLAKIPEIYIHKEITIHTQKLKEKLEKAGVDTSTDKVSVLLMYKVQGVDFLNYLLREAIKKCPEEESDNKPAVSNIKRQLDLDPRQVNTEDVFKAASVAIGFEDSERITLSKTNRQRLMTYLKKHNFVLDSAILEKVERTIKVLNDNDFYHNDLTERNFMLELDDDGQVTEIYLIDFEKASDKEDEEFGGDMAIAGQYKSLTTTNDQEIKEVVDKTVLSLSRLRDHITKARPEISNSIRDNVSRMLKEKDDEDIRHIEAEVFVIANSIVSDQAWELIGGILLEIAETNSEAVKAYINRKIKDTKTPTVYINLLSRIKKGL